MRIAYCYDEMGEGGKASTTLEKLLVATPNDPVLRVVVGEWNIFLNKKTGRQIQFRFIYARRTSIFVGCSQKLKSSSKAGTNGCVNAS